MRQRTNSIKWLKASAMVFAILAGAGLLLSSYRTRKLGDDMWKMLGISKQAGDEKIQNSFMYGYLYYYGVKNAKNLALNDRAAVAKDLMTYTKTYISSAYFKKFYEKWRQVSKPMEPQLKPMRSIETIQKEEIAKTEKSIRDTEKNMKEMPQYAKSMEPVLDMLKKNLKEYQDPKHQLFSSIAQSEKYEQENTMKTYRKNLDYWQKTMPEDINVFIADRLEKMLNATKDIDYDAGLVEKWGKKRFVNPAYESKNQEWKQGFRAGKAVTESARAFAQKWVEELKPKS